MINKGRVLHAFWILLLLIPQSCGTFKVAGYSTLYPQPHGYVNDYAGLLTASEEKMLEKQIHTLEKSTSDQIAVVLINSQRLHGTDLNTWTRGLGNYWGVGQKDKNNGIVIALLADTHELRVENANGITGRLSDAKTKEIIDNQMIPAFKKNEYARGLENGIRSIAEILTQN